MKPKLTTHPYKLEASEFAALYVGSIFRKYWYVFVPLLGFFLGKTIYDTIRNPSVFDFISYIVPGIIFVVVRYRFINSLNQSPAMHRSRIVKVYDHCLELEADDGMLTSFFFPDIASVSASRSYFRVYVKTGQIFWFPKKAFKTPEDQEAFETILREKGKMK